MQTLLEGKIIRGIYYFLAKIRGADIIMGRILLEGLRYPDVVYKVANDAILIQTRSVQNVVSLEKYIAILTEGCGVYKRETDIFWRYTLYSFVMYPSNSKW